VKQAQLKLAVKRRYHLFRRGHGVYCFLDTEKTNKPASKQEIANDARILLNAQNEACWQPATNLEIARVYLNHSDPAFATRNWQQVIASCLFPNHPFPPNTKGASCCQTCGLRTT
jgi:hypothetical protein